MGGRDESAFLALLEFAVALTAGMLAAVVRDAFLRVGLVTVAVVAWHGAAAYQSDPPRVCKQLQPLLRHVAGVVVLVSVMLAVQAGAFGSASLPSWTDPLSKALGGNRALTLAAVYSGAVCSGLLSGVTRSSLYALLLQLPAALAVGAVGWEAYSVAGVASLAAAGLPWLFVAIATFVAREVLPLLFPSAAGVLRRVLIPVALVFVATAADAGPLAALLRH